MAVEAAEVCRGRQVAEWCCRNRDCWVLLG